MTMAETFEAGERGAAIPSATSSFSAKPAIGRKAAVSQTDQKPFPASLVRCGAPCLRISSSQLLRQNRGGDMKRIPTPSPAMAVALVGVVIGLGGVAFATIPDSTGTIHGCRATSSGNLRVVESANDCRSNEVPIQWNQQGPPGPPGGDRDETAVAKLSIGQQQDLITLGPFTFRAECQESPFSDSGWVVLFSESTEAGSWVTLGVGAEFGPGNPVGFRGENVRGNFSSSAFGVAAPSGAAAQGVTSIGSGVLGYDCFAVIEAHLISQ